MNFNGPQIAITGATGFVGGALARALAQQGAEVRGLARATSDRSTLNGTPVSWHVGDLTSEINLETFLAGAEYIIHAAGRLGQPGVPDREYYLCHVEASRRLFEAASRMDDPPRILYISSPGVLGPTNGQEGREDSPLAPSNIYERTKAEAEDLARHFAGRGLPVIIVRPEFMYGPNDRHVLGLFKAIGRGQFFYVSGGRHFCHPTFIDDAVRGMLLCMCRGRAGETYHITGPRPVTFREFGDTIAGAMGVRPPWLTLPRSVAWSGAAAAELLSRMTGLRAPLTRSGVAFFSEDRRFSWQKAHQELGYVPQHDLSSGVARTVEWYRRHEWI